MHDIFDSVDGVKRGRPLFLLKPVKQSECVEELHCLLEQTQSSRGNIGQHFYAACSLFEAFNVGQQYSIGTEGSAEGAVHRR